MAVASSVLSPSSNEVFTTVIPSILRKSRNCCAASAEAPSTALAVDGPGKDTSNGLAAFDPERQPFHGDAITDFAVGGNDPQRRLRFIAEQLPQPAMAPSLSRTINYECFEPMVQASRRSSHWQAGSARRPHVRWWSRGQTTRHRAGSVEVSAEPLTRRRP